MTFNRNLLAAVLVSAAPFGVAPHAVTAADESAALQSNAAEHFGLVEASGLRWQHLSSRHGDLPAPVNRRSRQAAWWPI